MEEKGRKRRKVVAANDEGEEPEQQAKAPKAAKITKKTMASMDEGQVPSKARKAPKTTKKVIASVEEDQVPSKARKAPKTTKKGTRFASEDEDEVEDEDEAEAEAEAEDEDEDEALKMKTKTKSKAPKATKATKKKIASNGEDRGSSMAPTAAKAPKKAALPKKFCTWNKKKFNLPSSYQKFMESICDAFLDRQSSGEISKKFNIELEKKTMATYSAVFKALAPEIPWNEVESLMKKFFDSDEIQDGYVRFKNGEGSRDHLGEREFYSDNPDDDQNYFYKPYTTASKW